MPYANSYSGREKWNSCGKSGPVLMPPEPLPPWDRIRDRKYGYEHGHNHHNNNNNIGGGAGGGRGGGRWRDSPSSTFAAGSRISSEFSPRWGFPSDFRRPPGHIKPNGWHLYQEDSPNGYSTPRSNDRFLDDDGMRPSGPRGDSRYGRFHRDNRNGFGQKDFRGHSWENNRQYNGPSNTPGRPNSITSQRTLCGSPSLPSIPSHPNPDPSTQVNSKDQVDKTADANGSGVSPRLIKENSLGSLDWKPLKWACSGSSNSRGSGFSHSSSSKSNGGESNDVICDLAPKSVTPIESPSGDAAACSPSIAHSEETSSRKKARLGWGEGLAKYEKKKVDGPEENINKIENVDSVVNVGPTHSVNSTLVDKSPKITGISDCSSPATPSSFACSSSPGLEKTYGKTTDVDPNNFSVSSMPASGNQSEGLQLSLDKLELNSITHLSSLLSQLLQVDDQCSMDSGFTRSSAFSKLLLWKADISKALELTETEIDSLENELKLLKPDSDKDDKNGQSEGINGFARPLPFEVVSVEGGAGHNATRTDAEVKNDEIDSPGTATSKFEEPHSTQKPVSTHGWKNSCSLQDDFVESSITIPENLINCDNEKTTEGTSRQGDDPSACSKKGDDKCEIILNSNKSTASQASEVLIKLLHSDDYVNGMAEVGISCLPADTTVKEKFLRRKRLLKFKERVISLKYRAFHHLWKEDLRSLSSTSHRAKSQKKLDLISRSLQIGNQKQRPFIRSHFASPAGSSTLVPTTKVLNFTRKLLSDAEVKTYRSNLKMPAMFLDEKEKMSSTFGSNNGLVEDPCAIEKERALINPWIIEEKELFMEKLSAFGKDFRKIASFLDHKTVADCVQFYYKNHRSECFQKTKLGLKKQAKPLSSDTYMLTSGKKWSRDMNSASLDVLGEASVIAAQADQAMKTPKLSSGRLSNKKAKGLDGNFNVEDDERETVAADVLAGICGTLSSEPMSSCITSSVRRPLTPDVTQSVDDEDNNDDDGTCSDESGGEMGPVDWTDGEKSLFIQAFLSHGKDFLMISRFVRTKTRDQCKVFYSKARKCLGLENVIPGSNDTNGGGSDVDTGSIGCSNKSGSQMDEDVPHIRQDVSNPNSNAADLSTSEGNCGLKQLDCKDMEPEVLGPCDNAEVSNKSIESDDDRSKARGAVDSLTGVSLRVSSVIDPETIAEVANVESLSTCENKDSPVTNVLINCLQSTISCSSLANGGESEDLTGLPLDLSAKAETNSVITRKTGSESKIQSFQECYFRKGSRSVSQGSVSELPLLPKSEGRIANGHTMFNDTSNSEKPCSSGSGDVKLFGKILSKPCSIETTNHQLTPVCERDHNGFVGLENVPVRNYGIWDGSKIQVVNYPPPVNSSSLLAKYPSAFGNQSVSQTEQQTLQVPVNSGECHLNNACAFSPTEFPAYRNQDRVSPFMLDFKQRTNVIPCTAISDPVAVLRSHYVGQSVNGVAREEAWGGQGDVGR